MMKLQLSFKDKAFVWFIDFAIFCAILYGIALFD